MLKMENERFNVLACVANERVTLPEYPDEAVFSDLYHTSLSTALRAVEGYLDEEKRRRQDANEWIVEKSCKARNVCVINFDQVVKRLNNGRASCDAFFYNFYWQQGEYHFLCEFKNTGKQDFLRYLKSDNEDSIYKKVKDSAENISQCVVFGGECEADDIISNMHFFAVYNGKNTAATSSKPIVPTKENAGKGSNGKQNRATRNRQHEYTPKEENEIYQRFGEKIEQIGLKTCVEDTFPGNAIPRVKKSAHGPEKIRHFTIFSAQDFGKLVESGFFDHWNWGLYLPTVEDSSDIT